MSEPGILQLVQMLLTFFGVVLTFIVAIYTVKVQKEVTAAKTAIVTLEKNTNSIKDALVKVTGEAEHAKGVIQGKADVQGLEEHSG